MSAYAASSCTPRSASTAPCADTTVVMSALASVSSRQVPQSSAVHSTAPPTLPSALQFAACPASTATGSASRLDSPMTSTAPLSTPIRASPVTATPTPYTVPLVITTPLGV